MNTPEEIAELESVTERLQGAIEMGHLSLECLRSRIADVGYQCDTDEIEIFAENLELLIEVSEALLRRGEREFSKLCKAGAEIWLALNTALEVRAVLSAIDDQAR